MKKVIFRGSLKMPVLAKNASHFFNAETYAKKFGNDTNDGVALATSNLQLARLKNKKPASKISEKNGFSGMVFQGFKN